MYGATRCPGVNKMTSCVCRVPAALFLLNCQERCDSTHLLALPNRVVSTQHFRRSTTMLPRCPRNDVMYKQRTERPTFYLSKIHIRQSLRPLISKMCYLAATQSGPPLRAVSRRKLCDVSCC
ncbi:unnamed protein product [Ectocarpus sp. 12 AP-2014]